MPSQYDSADDQDALLSPSTRYRKANKAKYAQAKSELSKTYNWPRRPPRKLSEIGASPLVVGNTFPSVDRALLVICEISEYANSRHTFQPLKNDNVAPTQEDGDSFTSREIQSFYGRHTAPCIKRGVSFLAVHFVSIFIVIQMKLGMLNH